MTLAVSDYNEDGRKGHVHLRGFQRGCHFGRIFAKKWPPSQLQLRHQHEVTLNQDALLSLCRGHDCRNNPIACSGKQNPGCIQGPLTDIFSHLPATLPALAAPEPHDHTTPLPCTKPSLCSEERGDISERGEPSVHVLFS